MMKGEDNLVLNCKKNTHNTSPSVTEQWKKNVRAKIERRAAKSCLLVMTHPV